MRVGLISDTHNVLRPEVINILKTCDEIWHAGDFCEPEIWEALNALKPLRSVQGNNDDDPFFERLHTVEIFDCEGLHVAMAHIRQSLDCVAADLKIYGHSHQVEDQIQGSTRWLNPGSCGRRRFRLELTMMVLTIRDRQIQAELIVLQP